MTRHLRVVPDAPDVDWPEACAVAMFRAIREDVTNAVAYGLTHNLPAEPVSVCDAAIGMTIAALNAAGWLVIPERPERQDGAA